MASKKRVGGKNSTKGDNKVTSVNNNNKSMKAKPRTRSKGTLTANNGNHVMLNKAYRYHELKREVLAPFLATLLICYKFDDLKASLNNEITMMDISTTAAASDPEDSDNENRSTSTPDAGRRLFTDSDVESD